MKIWGLHIQLFRLLVWIDWADGVHGVVTTNDICHIQWFCVGMVMHPDYGSKLFRLVTGHLQLMIAIKRN